MKFTFTEAEGLPLGSYAAKFSAAEPFENDFGPGVRLVFEVLQGEHQGRKSSRICSQKLSSKSNLFKFVQSLKGSKLEPGEQVDLADYIGASGMMIVEQTDSGASRVGSFIKMS